MALVFLTTLNFQQNTTTWLKNSWKTIHISATVDELFGDADDISSDEDDVKKDEDGDKEEEGGEKTQVNNMLEGRAPLVVGFMNSLGA